MNIHEHSFGSDEDGAISPSVQCSCHHVSGWVVEMGGLEENWGLKLISAKVEVEVETELGNMK